MKPVTIFRHIECEGPGYLDTVLRRRDVPTHLIAIDRGDTIPDTPRNTSGAISMGGPMSVNDSDTWIAREVRYLRQAINQNLPVLGHCLGGQLIAKALKAKVSKNPVREIGWLDVQHLEEMNQPTWLQNFHQPQAVFHWHGETFELPAGATRLLSSAHCKNQAFMYNENVYAFQCHIEMTDAMVHEWSTLYESELTAPNDTVQPRDKILEGTARHIAQLHHLADQIYDQWIGKLAP